MSRIRFRTIDSIRGFSALWVVSYHSWSFLWIGLGSIMMGTRFVQGHPGAYSGPQLMVAFHGTFQNILKEICNTVLGIGHLGVPLFFIVSGFCIHLPAARPHAEGERFVMNHRRYAWRRFWRLYPTHAFAIAGSMLLVLIGNCYLAGTAWAPDQTIPWSVYLAHFAMVQAQLPQTANYVYAFNVSLWTLETEVQLYIAYLLLWRIAQRWGWSRMLYVFAFGDVLYHAFCNRFLPQYGWATATCFVGHLYTWCLGAFLVEELYAKRSEEIVWRTLAKCSCIVVGTVLLVNDALFHFRMVHWMVFASCAAAPLWLLLQREVAGLPILPGALWCRFWGWLGQVGERSYSVYLWHSPVLRLFTVLFLVHAEWLIGNTYWALGAGVVSFLAAYYVGWGSFYLVERHFLNPMPPPALADMQRGLKHLLRRRPLPLAGPLEKPVAEPAAEGAG